MCIVVCACICTISVNSAGLSNDCMVISLCINVDVEGLFLFDALNLPEECEHCWEIYWQQVQIITEI